MVVLAEKLGVSVAETRRAYPRLATVPFDSDYKFMATFHLLPWEGASRIVGLAKGGPDVISGGAPCCTDGPCPAGRLARDRPANAELARHAVVPIAEQSEAARRQSRSPFVEDLIFVGIVGIIDPLRPEAIEAVRVAHDAGIDVRMITGDHLITAEAIGKELGLGEGGMTGAQFAAATDDEVRTNLPQVHVFGRVSPQDKLRLVQ